MLSWVQEVLLSLAKFVAVVVGVFVAYIVLVFGSIWAVGLVRPQSAEYCDPNPYKDSPCYESLPLQPPTQNSDPLYQALRKRCADETRTSDPVGVFFSSQRRVLLSDSFQVEAVVAPVNHFTSPTTAPSGEGASAAPPKQGGADVSCYIRARLVPSPDDFDLAPEGWQRQTYLPPAATQWTWNLKPQRTGKHTVGLELQPIAVVRSKSSPHKVREVPITSPPYSIRVTVNPSLWERIESFAGRAQTVTALVLSLAAVVALVKSRRIISAAMSKIRKRWGVKPEREGDGRPDGYL